MNARPQAGGWGLEAKALRVPGRLEDVSFALPQGCLAAQVAKNGNTETFGLALFHAYSFPFEVTSVLLVIAVLGAVVLGQRALRAGREAPLEQNGATEREPEEVANAR